MIIEKILNNNVIVTHDADGREVVAMGRGLAFGKKNGSRVDDASVDKVYRLSDPKMLNHFKELVAGLNPDYMDASNAIIESAQQELGVTFDDSIYISLTDHIHMAIHRIRKDLPLRNMMLWETKRFYPKEYGIAEKAIAYLSKRFSVTLPEDEAGFIAMHLIDAQSPAREPMAERIVELIAEITNIVRLAGSIEYDKDSLAYYRFVTHLKFFAKRMFSDTQHAGEEIDAEMAAMIAAKYKLAHACVEKVAAFVEKKYGYHVNDDERFYLTIHIAKVLKQSASV
ncbi:BglG family transcription antiterminator LicT [uncultured Selenomonas sp.]|uniref:BglG family transcription antiterminator LicT n=1 Tax=uncultured Selenomonas sp. TaxID=159275 RepID=UPI0026012C9F|nr:PRD domain-containing protein [uncultured Selenomonas sp.]